MFNDFDSRLVVAVEKLVGDLAGGSSLCELEGLRTEPLHTHD